MLSPTVPRNRVSIFRGAVFSHEIIPFVQRLERTFDAFDGPATGAPTYTLRNVHTHPSPYHYYPRRHAGPTRHETGQPGHIDHPDHPLNEHRPQQHIHDGHDQHHEDGHSHHIIRNDHEEPSHGANRAIHNRKDEFSFLGRDPEYEEQGGFCIEDKTTFHESEHGPEVIEMYWMRVHHLEEGEHDPQFHGPVPKSGFYSFSMRIVKVPGKADQHSVSKPHFLRKELPHGMNFVLQAHMNHHTGFTTYVVHTASHTEHEWHESGHDGITTGPHEGSAGSVHGH